MRKISKRSIIFPECSRISASASVTNSLCQSAEGLPGVEPVGWATWYQNKQKIYSYIRLQKPSAWFLFYYCVLLCKLQLRCRYKQIPKQWPFRNFHLFCLLLKSNTLLVLIFLHTAIHEHYHIYANIPNQNKCVYLDLRSSVFFSCHHWSGVWKYCNNSEVKSD